MSNGTVQTRFQTFSHHKRRFYRIEFGMLCPIPVILGIIEIACIVEFITSRDVYAIYYFSLIMPILLATLYSNYSTLQNIRIINHMDAETPQTLSQKFIEGMLWFQQSPSTRKQQMFRDGMHDYMYIVIEFIANEIKNDDHLTDLYEFVLALNPECSLDEHRHLTLFKKS